MKLIIGADHRGHKLKEALKKSLHKYNIIDVQAELVPGDDYPDVAKKASEEVLKKRAPGILICGTGIGMSIAANKIPGIRAGHVESVCGARLAKEDNNCNVLTLSGTLKPQDAKRIVNAWLTATFLKGRHARRLRKISAME